MIVTLFMPDVSVDDRRNPSAPFTALAIL